MVGLRELNINGIPENNWINDHFKYTHGYGIVAAKGTTATGDADAGNGPTGQPVYTEQDLPTTGELGTYQQRIYFGEQTTQYSIVGRPHQGAGLRRQDRREVVQLHGPRRGQPEQPGDPGRLRGDVRRAADPVLGGDRQRLARSCTTAPPRSGWRRSRPG